jgi:hypothetical protein
MNHECITAYPERIEDVVKISIQAMKNKEGLFASVDTQPERNFVNLAKSYGSEFALNAMFLVTPMVLGGRTEPFFRKISVPERFEKNLWLMNPKNVVEHNEEDVIKACFAFFRPAGRQAEPIFGYYYNCKKITDDYGGSVSNFLKKRDGDALRIYKDLTVYPRAKTPLKEIRRFGPKIAKLFIQWVNEYNLYDLRNADRVGLPVDFQVGRVIVQTNGLVLSKPVDSNFITIKVLPLVFDDLVTKGYKPEEISKALWAIGSGGCKFKRHSLCPLEKYCTSLISSSRYDNDGVFDPTDIGRYK